MQYIVPIILLAVFSMPVIVIVQYFFKYDQIKESRLLIKNNAKRLKIQTDIDLLEIELDQAKKNISFIEQMKSLGNYQNFPKRYYDYKRVTEFSPTNISRLKKELETIPIPTQKYDSISNMEYLNNILAPLKIALKTAQEMKEELEFQYDGNGTPKRWYELSEKESLLKEKVSFLESQIHKFKY